MRTVTCELVSGGAPDPVVLVPTWLCPPSPLLAALGPFTSERVLGRHFGHDMWPVCQISMLTWRLCLAARSWAVLLRMDNTAWVHTPSLKASAHFRDRVNTRNPLCSTPEQSRMTFLAIQYAWHAIWCEHKVNVPCSPSDLTRTAIRRYQSAVTVF